MDACKAEVGGELATKWNVTKIVSCKGKSRGNGTYEPVPKSCGSTISWDTFILVKISKQVAAEELGGNLARELTNFMKYSVRVSAKFNEVH